MAKRRLPMVGDAKPTSVDCHQDTSPSPPRRGSFSKEDAESFPWEKYRDLLLAYLPYWTTKEDLVDYWKSNANMLEWAEKVKPDVYEQIRTAFAVRKQQIGALNG